MQLAEITGFSQGAISRAFNGQGGISETTRVKILKSAREIGYHPNPSARNFKRGYTKRIGIILPNLANANYSELYEKLDLVASDSGYASILALAHHSAERERNLMYQMSAGEADGLVVNPIFDQKNVEVYLRLKSWGYPLLFVYKGYEDEFDCLYVDHLASLRKAMQYLRDVGHKKVAYVGFTPNKAIGKHAQVITVIKELGMQYDEQLSVLGVSEDAAGEEAFRHWRAVDKYPTAVIALNDQTAISLCREARCHGLRVPEDISLLGGDDIAPAEPMEISTLRVDRQVMARQIFEMLENRIKNFDSPIRSKVIRTQFILRGSTGPVRRDEHPAS